MYKNLNLFPTSISLIDLKLITGQTLQEFKVTKSIEAHKFT